MRNAWSDRWARPLHLRYQILLNVPAVGTRFSGIFNVGLVARRRNIPTLRRIRARPLISHGATHVFAVLRRLGLNSDQDTALIEPALVILCLLFADSDADKTADNAASRGTNA